jgi:hypothetical protein
MSDSRALVLLRPNQLSPSVEPVIYDKSLGGLVAGEEALPMCSDSL